MLGIIESIRRRFEFKLVKRRRTSRRFRFRVGTALEITEAWSKYKPGEVWIVAEHTHGHVIPWDQYVLESEVERRVEFKGAVERRFQIAVPSRGEVAA